MSTFHCKECGRAVFHSTDIIDKRIIWDLKEYQAECYLIIKAIDADSLRRYDCSLHEGWYCCRFIMMRMTENKFGTGRNLLVYTDSVTEVPEGDTVQPPKVKNKSIVKLTKRDFDQVILGKKNSVASDSLMVIKFSALWCPPCRLMDTVLGRIHQSGDLPNVHFFEVDIDEEQELASRWHFRSIPYTLFFKQGKQIDLSNLVAPTVNGGLIGGITEASFRKLCLAIQT